MEDPVTKRHHVILATTDDCRCQDEYRIDVIHWPWGDFEVYVDVHYGLDEQDEPVFQKLLLLETRDKDEMLRWMPTHVKRLLSPELYEKLSRILAGENVVR